MVIIGPEQSGLAPGCGMSADIRKIVCISSASVKQNFVRKMFLFFQEFLDKQVILCYFSAMPFTPSRSPESSRRVPVPEGRGINEGPGGQNRRTSSNGSQEKPQTIDDWTTDRGPEYRGIQDMPLEYRILIEATRKEIARQGLREDQSNDPLSPNLPY